VQWVGKQPAKPLTAFRALCNEKREEIVSSQPSLRLLAGTPGPEFVLVLQAAPAKSACASLPKGNLTMLSFACSTGADVVKMAMKAAGDTWRRLSDDEKAVYQGRAAGAISAPCLW
jgi:hypothetical protein